MVLSSTDIEKPDNEPKVIASFDDGQIRNGVISYGVFYYWPEYYIFY
ncbi:MAG TPA: hypothetical protein PLR75_00420 [Candidatus Pacearchaeota archaeon]|nr:hypothetical protein [Candidatus Pacearchaeota archaeon]